MRICIVSSGSFWSSYGGGQVYVRNIVDEMIRRQEKLGIELVIISQATGGKAANRHLYKGIKVKEIETGQEIAKVLKEERPDVVHANGMKVDSVLACKVLQIPCIVTAHHGGIVCPTGTLLDYEDRICQKRGCREACLKCYLHAIPGGSEVYPLMRRLPEERYIRLGKKLKERRFVPFISPIGGAGLDISIKEERWRELHESCSRIIAPSNAMAEALIRNGCKREKVVVEPHGIPLIRREERREEGDGMIRFYYSGRVTYIKGVHVMIKAFRAIENTGAELHIIGEGGKSRREKRYSRYLHRLARGGNRIVWHGKVEHEELKKLTAGYDVLIHPALYLETFGLDIAEALSEGHYVIASRCGGAEEQIEGEGTLVPTNDVGALKRAMEEYIGHPRQSAAKVRSIEEHVARLMEIYRGGYENQ